MAEVVTGNTPSKAEPENFGGDIPFFKPPQLTDSVVDGAPESLSAQGAKSARLVPAETVLVSCIGVLGKTAITKRPAATNQQINAVVFAGAVEPKFGFYYAQTLTKWLIDASSATTVPIVNKGKFEGAPFPLAPIAEQARIVAKLEELLSDLDAGVAELKAAQKKLQQYRQSLLKAAVEGSLTASWRAQRASPSPQPLPRQRGGAKASIAHEGEAAVAPLSPRGRGVGGEGELEKTETGAELLARILKERRARWEAKQLARFREQGKAPPRDWQAKYPEPVAPDTTNLPQLPQGWVWARVNQTGEVQLGRQRAPQFHSGANMVPYLRVANVFENRIDISDVMEMHFSKEEEETFRLRKNDILLNEGQSLELIGRPAIYRDELPRACFTNTLVRYRAESGVLPEYALAVFLHFMHSGRFRKIATITTNIAHLGAGRFAELEFPLPSRAEQVEIVSQLAEHMEKIAQQQVAITTALKQSTAQRQNILRAAFAGQLVPQDPNDEPASVLLERIRAERQAASGGKPATRKPRAKTEAA